MITLLLIVAAPVSGMLLILKRDGSAAINTVVFLAMLFKPIV